MWKLILGHGIPYLIYKFTTSVRASVCDHWMQRKVMGKRKVTMDAKKSDGKKKSDDGHREKWQEKDKTTVGWRAFEVLKPRSWEPNTEGLKPRSWDPGPETSHWGPETQVLRSRSWNLALRSWNPGPESQISRSWHPGPESVRALLIGWSN